MQHFFTNFLEKKEFNLALLYQKLCYLKTV
uniref:Uncharacterized protein n=1 Tax=Siphoviridae sp. ctxYv12 TaxID=2827974 RepID=A0A8S5S4B4_9CAUD|nr:MAG TPA: hypothetical protein [Siphoviridae sp. ctxYv12]